MSPVNRFYPAEKRYHSRSSKSPRGVGFAFCGLFTVATAWSLLAVLSSPGSVEAQTHSGYGCRYSSPVLLLTFQSDGRILWPDGASHSLDESKTLLAAACATDPERGLALLAAPDAKLEPCLDLLDTAQLMGLTRVVLATPANYQLP